MRGGTTRDADLRSPELWYGWDHNSLGVGPPLDTVSLKDPAAKLAIGEKVQP